MTNKDLIKRPEDSLSRLFNFDRLHDMVNNFESSFWEGFEDFGPWHAKVFEEIQPRMTLPKVNVIDKPEAYKIEIAMAGFGKEDLELQLKDNCLFIKLEHNEERAEQQEEEEYLLREISSRSFRRVIRFPMEIDSEEASCVCKDGIATCTIAKILEEGGEDEEKPIKIKVS